jgi:hypothetical protein
MTREVKDADAASRATGLEIHLLFADARGLRHLRSAAAAILAIDETAADHPTLQARRAAERLGLIPRFVHSTSWRYEGGRVVLTYVVVVDPPLRSVPGLEDVPIGRGGLARCEPLEPPASIESEHVLEHTIRHLSWLVREDPAAREILEPWAPFLAEHRAEPFRSFEGGEGLPLAPSDGGGSEGTAC